MDILPPEIIHELAGWQDKVAPAAFEDVVLQVEKDFNRPKRLGLMALSAGLLVSGG